MAKFQSELLENPTFGVNIALNLYKCRMAIAAKGKGKSGGARVITYVLVRREQVFLIAIYNPKLKAFKMMPSLNGCERLGCL